MDVTVPNVIAGVLDAALASRPSATAIEAVSGAWSYAELDHQARRAAGALWSLGVRPGHRVAACLPNDLDIVAAFHGAQRIGAVWAGIGEALAGSEQQELHDLCDPTVVLAGPRCRLSSPDCVDPDRWAGLVARDEAAPRVELDAGAPAGIAFTRTSGRSKAVAHSQRNLLLPGAVLVATRGWGPGLRKGDSFPLTILNEPGPVPTGDVGTVDGDGWLTVLDRKKLVIIRGGANVYPLEVERVIAAHPDVARVAVCAVPDDRLGQRVAAVVESAGPALDLEALAGLCRRELSPYKVPEIWSQVDALPVNAMGKVQRARLPELVDPQRPPGTA